MLTDGSEFYVLKMSVKTIELFETVNLSVMTFR